MTRYWKADVLRKLIKIEEENEYKATISMSYLVYLKKMLKWLEMGREELSK